MFSCKTCRGEGLAKMGVGEKLWVFSPPLFAARALQSRAGPEGSLQDTADGGMEGQHPVSKVRDGGINELSVFTLFCH